MKVLITGGAGFIGSHLAEACLNQNAEVYVIDDFSTGSPYNVRAIEANTGAAHRLFFYEDSIMNRSLMLRLVGSCDVVFHLAAAVGVRYILDHPLESIKTNIQGTEIVLELCDSFRKTVLVASSSEVYGKHLHAPLVETDDVVFGPSSKFRWSYAATKLMEEFSALAYHRTRGLNVVIARLFNTVGPRQTGVYGMVIPRLVGQAIEGKPLTVYGDGKQTRTFADVQDVVQALMALVTCSSAYGEVINIGGREETSMQKLAEKIISKTGSASPIQHVPYEEVFEEDFEDMHRRVPGTEKLKRLTGFEAGTDLDAILARVIEAEQRKSGSQRISEIGRVAHVL